MFSFVIRLYGLSIDNFFEHSFFYFYSVQIKKTMLNSLKKKDIKISYLYNNSFNKKNQAFVLYSKLPFEIFNICTTINNIYSSGNKVLTSLSYNSVSYNHYYYYNISIKKTYSNWIHFFHMDKFININYYNTTIKYDKKLKFFSLFFSIKQYKKIFHIRFRNITLL